MPKPVRIQLSRAKGWKMPPNTGWNATRLIFRGNFWKPTAARPGSACGQVAVLETRRWPVEGGEMSDDVQKILLRYRKQISATPALMSLLYDADLLPEQIVSMRGAVSMAAVCIAYEEGFRAAATRPTASPSQEQEP